MKTVLPLLLLSLAISAAAQSKHTHTPAKPITAPKMSNDASGEPHHKIVFENAKTRIYRVDLPAGATTEVHTHARDYIMIALTNVAAANEFERSKSKTDSTQISMSPGELQIMKVPQTAKLVNLRKNPADPSGSGHEISFLEVEIPGGFHPDLIVCGMGKRSCPSDVGDISDPAHQFSINFLFETDALRVHDITIGPGAELPERVARYDLARIAVTPLDLSIGGSQSAHLNSGDVQWTTAGDLPKFINNGKDEARFYEIEFK